MCESHAHFSAGGKVCDQEPESEDCLLQEKVQEEVANFVFDLWISPNIPSCNQKQHLAFQITLQLFAESGRALYAN